jgi:hypothetical protein
MSDFPAPWALCGGWAVDAWLGGQSREHGDIDVSVFVQDQQALFGHLSGWQMVAHDPHNLATVRWEGRPLGLPGHLHCRPDTGEALPDTAILTKEQGFVLDVELGDRSGDRWLLSREPRISLQLGGAVQQSPWGLPTVIPPVLLFFKSRDLRRRDKLDFAALLPRLSDEQRDWLRGVIATAGHPWLTEI